MQGFNCGGETLRGGVWQLPGKGGAARLLYGYAEFEGRGEMNPGSAALVVSDVVSVPVADDWRGDLLGADETADGLGMSRRAMFRDLALHRAIVAPFPQLWRALATHPVVGENASALHKIAGIKDEGSRRDLIEGLIAAPEMTLDQALEGLGLSRPVAPAATGATKFMNGTTSNLARLSAGDQARIAPEIVKTMKPSALLALRTALDARIQEEGIEA